MKNYVAYCAACDCEVLVKLDAASGVMIPRPMPWADEWWMPSRAPSVAMPHPMGTR